MVTDTVTEVRRYNFTVDEFAKMGEAGIFTAEDRVELIDGEIREMAPIGSHHAAIVSRLNVTLVELLKRTAILEVQNPLRLDSHNEPQPDFSIVKARDDYYETSLPEPGDTLLVIEVADSTLAYDIHDKTPRYARYMIPEVWVVDVEAKVVRVFTQPGPGGYANERVMQRGSTITSASVEGLRVGVNEIFG
jgi:Uma2 family endonuclease